MMRNSLKDVRKSRNLKILLLYVTLTLPVSMRGNSLSFQPLEIPKGDDVADFSNGLLPPTGKRILKTKDDIVGFLQNSKVNNNIAQWDDLKYEQPDSFSKEDIHCEGVFVDKKGGFYFWILRSPRVLELETSDGRMAILELVTPPQSKSKTPNP